MALLARPARNGDSSGEGCIEARHLQRWDIASSYQAIEAHTARNDGIDETGGTMVYPGGKGLVYQKIINLIPPHRTYIETHLGGGSVMKAKRPARVNIGIDRNPIVLAQTASEIQPGGCIVTGDDAHDRARASLETARGSRIAESGDSAGAIATTDDGAPQWFFVVGDARQYLSSYQFHGDEFVYSDPPYVMSTRKSGRRFYDFEYDDSDHVEWLSFLKTLPCPVSISGYFSELYADMLSGWRTVTFMSQTRGGTPAEEWLWMNYPEPFKLHEYTYLGENFRERERIKRKKQRWVNRLQRLDKLEAQAILWAIAESGIEAGVPVIYDGSGDTPDIAMMDADPLADSDDVPGLIARNGEYGHAASNIVRNDGCCPGPLAVSGVTAVTP